MPSAASSSPTSWARRANSVASLAAIITRRCLPSRSANWRATASTLQPEDMSSRARRPDTPRRPARGATRRCTRHGKKVSRHPRGCARRRGPARSDTEDEEIAGRGPVQLFGQQFTLHGTEGPGDTGLHRALPQARTQHAGARAGHAPCRRGRDAASRRTAAPFRARTARPRPHQVLILNEDADDLGVESGSQTDRGVEIRAIGRPAVKRQQDAPESHLIRSRRHSRARPGPAWRTRGAARRTRVGVARPDD